MAYPPERLHRSEIPGPVVRVGRAALADDVANATAYLASPEASYVTGASLLVDGGLLLASGPQELEAATGLPPAREQQR
jgi:NAD(P)-dependent dehydrogenase (short-subunit alcohol dehydrogenase family)